MTPKAYIGWIPTVAGQLSFRNIGNTRHPRQSHFRSFLHQGKRRTFACQRRTTSDKIFKRFLNKTDDDILYVMDAVQESATTKDHEENLTTRKTLRGHIFIFSKVGNERINRLLHLKTKDIGIKTLYATENLFAAYSNFDSKKHLKPIAFPLRKREKIETLKDSILKMASDEFVFHLSDTGQVKILRISNQKRPTSARTETEQVFFFLKDICHTHQHHDPFTDTMIGAYPATDRNWKIKTHEILMEKAISFKQEKSHYSLSTAEGIIKYAEAFHLGVAAHSGIPQINYTLLSDSIKVSLNIKNISQNEISKTLMLHILPIITSAGLLFSYLNLVNKMRNANTPENTTYLKNFTEFFISSQFGNGFVILLILYCAFSVAAIPRIEKTWHYRVLIGELRRLTIAIGLKKILILILSAPILLTLGYGIVFFLQRLIT